MERCLCCALLIAYYIIVQRLYQLQKMFADYHPSFQPYYSRKLMCMILDWLLGGSLLIIMFMLLTCWQIYLNAMTCFLILGTNYTGGSRFECLVSVSEMRSLIIGWETI